MIKFSKKQIQTVNKKIRKSVKKGKGYPKKFKLTDTNGKTHKLTRKQYYGVLQQYNLYKYNHGKRPATVTYNGKSKEPIIINYQDNKYQCACASFNMCLQKYGIWRNEGDIARTFGTSTSGTAPSQIITGAKKYGYKVEAIARNPKSVQKALDKGYAIIAHIDTIKAPSLGYLHNYGHYIVISRITKAGNYRVFDPTKGIISIKTSELDQAMLNRQLNYYAVYPM